MPSRPFATWIRWALFLQVALFLAQFEVGEWLTIFGDFPATRMLGLSLATFAYNVTATGPALVAHAILGIGLFANAAIVFMLSLRVRVHLLRPAAGLGLLSVAAAGSGGLLFVVQGFAGDRSLFLMGTGFIAAFAFTGFALYLVLASRHGAVPADTPPDGP